MIFMHGRVPVTLTVSVIPKKYPVPELTGINGHFSADSCSVIDAFCGCSYGLVGSWELGRVAEYEVIVIWSFQNY